jgi:hypothetical protein
VALSDGLIDDLDWLSAEAATVALYEIASALPQGSEKREVGRRVAANTYDGTSDTFAAVATRMAVGSGKGLSGPQMRARVALVLELPFGQSPRVDALAFALASRRDLVKDGSRARRGGSRAPARGAAARGRRAKRRGSPPGGRARRARVSRRALARSCEELLWDREPLVWKHAAVAQDFWRAPSPPSRGRSTTTCPLLLSADPVAPRRGASLGAWIGVDPIGWPSASTALGERRLAQDYGVAGCLVWGLAHGAG